MTRLVKFDEEGATDAEIEVYLLVVKIAKKYGVDPSGSVEAEEYFRKLLEEYTGEFKDLPLWLEEQIPRHFAVTQERPRWIQSFNWPFSNNIPMVFAGQIDISVQNGQSISEIYHDDTSLYVFIGKEVSPVVIVQQF